MLVLTLIVHHKLNTRYNRAQYKFPVPVQWMGLLKVVAVSGQTTITTASSLLSNLGQSAYGRLLHMPP